MTERQTDRQRKQLGADSQRGGEGRAPARGEKSSSDPRESAGAWGGAGETGRGMGGRRGARARSRAFHKHSPTFEDLQTQEGREGQAFHSVLSLAGRLSPHSLPPLLSERHTASAGAPGNAQQVRWELGRVVQGPGHSAARRGNEPAVALAPEPAGCSTCGINPYTGRIRVVA